MSKRAHEGQESELENKRNRASREGHTEDCQDDLCEGCDVGEVEISFVRKDAQGQTVEPSAQELLVMAIEESNDDIKKRLFDLALDKYQKDEPENRVGYATCLVELGKGIDVQESIREGLDVLRGEKTKTTEVLLALSGAAIALVNSIRQKQIQYLVEEQQKLEENDDDEEEIEENEELKQKQKPSKEETKIYAEAVDSLTEALKAKSSDEALFKEAHTVLNEMRTYGQSLNIPYYSELSTKVLHTVVDLIKQLPDYEQHDEALTLWAACLLNEQKPLETEEEQMKVMDKIESLLNDANKIHAKQNEGKENPWVWQMLAMNRINQSNLAEDEDQAIELYEGAIEAFKKAIALKPDDHELAAMFQVIAASEEKANAAAEDEDEEEE
ncbi:hypothetical protein EDC96DRAFT_518913 [Choanephora cucurbitarum]|nr:hypothetical protein EDC96DRAFT_518913 [Choanephora cucurbitarum]